KVIWEWDRRKNSNVFGWFYSSHYIILHHVVYSFPIFHTSVPSFHPFYLAANRIYSPLSMLLNLKIVITSSFKKD
ncbi:hypothetical protein L9F63_004214, partial [Diploptera punctata]